MDHRVGRPRHVPNGGRRVAAPARGHRRWMAAPHVNPHEYGQQKICTPGDQIRSDPRHPVFGGRLPATTGCVAPIRAIPPGLVLQLRGRRIACPRTLPGGRRCTGRVHDRGSLDVLVTWSDSSQQGPLATRHPRRRTARFRRKVVPYPRRYVHNFVFEPR